MKKRICIVMSTYNQDITNELFNSAKKELEKSGIIKIDIFKVPGAFEIPVSISKLSKKYDGFIAIGCIIKGETYHFEIIANETSRKIMDLSVENNKPIGFGILTCYDLNQAIIRSDINQKNKGREAALACIDLLF